KGSRAFYILGPVTRKIRGEDPNTGEETERVITTGFVGIPVFRYEDTEGAELERPDYRPATFPPLYDVAARVGVRVDYLPFVDRFRGYYSPGENRIVLCSHDECTFFHELAHVAHRQVTAAEEWRGGQNPKREIVAETVAATLCRLYGLDGY